MAIGRHLERGAFLIPAIAAAIAYLPALGNGFVWDDNDLFLNQPFLRTPGMWADALGDFLLMLSANYFRPVAVASFLAEARAWGLEPFGFHLTNVALHSLNALLVTLLARELLRGRPGLRSPAATAAAVGLAYALHPALVESVSFVSSRFDLLMTTWVALALLADARLERRPAPRALAVGLLFLAAALSKETALAFPAILALWRRARPAGAGRPAARAGLQAALALAVAGAAYLALRAWALGHLYEPGSTSEIPAGDPLQRALLVGRSAAEYAALAAFPFGTLSPLHVSTLPVPTDDAAAWLGLAGIAAAGAALIAASKRIPSTSALILAGIAALAPALNVVPLELNGGAFAAERYLTLPLAALSLALGAAWAELGGLRARLGRIAPAALVAAWLAACAVAVWTTVPRWRDAFSLWTWAAVRAPASGLPHVNLADHHLARGDYARALSEADAALGRDPGNAMGWNNRGAALFNLGRLDDARSAWERAVRIEPRHPLFWNNLANALRALGRFGEAERTLIDESLRLDPSFGIAHYSLGNLYLAGDRPDLAVAPLTRAVELMAPGEQAAAREALGKLREPGRWLRLGELLLGRGDAEGAGRAFGRALSLGAPPAEVAAARERLRRASGLAKEASTPENESLKKN